MSVLSSRNWLGEARVDVPHLRALDSSICGDFDALAGVIVAGKRPLVVTGFTINTTSIVGAPLNSTVLITAGGALLDYTGSASGTILTVPTTQASETLNATNPNVQGSFGIGTSYVGLDITRTANSATSDLVQFLDVNTDSETPRIVPLARTLSYKIVISSIPFESTPTLVPVAVITSSDGLVVTTIQDARPMLGRLGSGGTAPNSEYAYPFPQSRIEGLAASLFSGGDKAIQSLKDWMDAVMTRIHEVGGGQYWYSAAANRNVLMVETGAAYTDGTYFQWSGTQLQFKGLKFLFDNSANAGIYFNTVTDSGSPGFTMIDGDCIYVDLDTSSNATVGASVVQLVNMGQGTPSGARNVIAYRKGSQVFARGNSLPIGSVVPVATTTTLGIVELHQASLTPLIPVVISDGDLNTANGVVGLDANRSASVTAAGGGAPGLNATGNAAGNGVNGVGGSSSAAGIQGTGGATDGIGVQGFGTGVGEGVFGEGGTSSGTGGTFIGGSANGIGVTSAGTGSGIGVFGSGGATAGIGVQGTGASDSGSGAGPGVKGIGGNGGVFSGGSAGVVGIGGNEAPGVVFAGVGVVATGGVGGGGLGILATGSAGNAGGQFTAGTTATSSVAQTALVSSGGYISISAANPNSNVGFSNKITPKNVCKAWGLLTTGASPSISDGFNISSVATNGNNIRITVVNGFTGAGPWNYIVNVTISGVTNKFFGFGQVSGTQFDIQACDTAGTAVNIASSVFTVGFSVLGTQ